MFITVYFWWMNNLECVYVSKYLRILEFIVSFQFNCIGLYDTSSLNCFEVCLMLAQCSVSQLCPAVFDPMDCSPVFSSVHGIFQERILQWIVISFSRVSSLPRDWTWISHIAGRIFTIWDIRKSTHSHLFVSGFMNLFLFHG